MFYLSDLLLHAIGFG
ncbi:hypothetical protein [Escherichia coli]